MQQLLCFLLTLVAIPSAAQQDTWYAAMRKAESARQSGQMNEARQAYDDALQAAESNPALATERAMAIGKRASLWHDLQRTREAESGYRTAIEILRRQPTSELVQRQVVALIISLAALYLEQGQPSKALKLDVEGLIPTIRNPANLATAYSILASMARAQGRLAGAEGYWQKAMSVFDAEANSEEVGVVLNNLGVLAYEKRDFAASVKHLRRAVQIFTALGRLGHPSTVKMQANLGQALFQLERYEESADWLGRAHAIAQKWYGEESIVTAQVGLYRVEALRKAGRKEEAKTLADAIRRLPAGVAAMMAKPATVDILSLSRTSGRK